MSAAEHVRLWLARRLTGCHFAGVLAGSGNGIAFSVFPNLAAATVLDSFLDAAASQHLPAIGVFPAIRSEAQLVEQLRGLAAGDRWTVSIEAPEGLQTDDTLVGIRWRTPTGVASAPMGLAPLPTMPVTRRAPHTCIAAWPGGHENPYWVKYRPETVDFLDTHLDASKLPRTKYRERWQKSVAETTAMLSDPPDSAANYRMVAFRLSAQARASIEGFVG